MKKRIVSVLLCVALTMIPAMSSFATEAETDSNTTPSSEIVVEKLDKDTNPSKDNKKSSVEEKNTKSEKPTSTEKSDETPASDNEDSKDEKENELTEESDKTTTPPSEDKTKTAELEETKASSPTSDSTETPTPKEESEETSTSKDEQKETSDTTVTSTPDETPDSDIESKDDVDLTKSRAGAKGPLGASGDTTWQEDWRYTLGDSSIILRLYKGTGETELVVPASATVEGKVYDKVEFDHASSFMFGSHTELTTIDLTNVDTGNVTDMLGMFYSCKNLTALNLTGFNTSNVTNMSSMFSGCNNLTSLDVSGFDTSNVTNMEGMFSGCNNLTSLDLSSFNTSNVTDMSDMFAYCEKLTGLDVSKFNTANVTQMYGMFMDCTGLTSLDVSGFNTGNVINIGSMFGGCGNLTNLDVSGFDTSNVTYMTSMFGGCSSLTNLDVSGFNTGNVTSIYGMFGGCSSLTNLDVSGFDTSKADNMFSMFAGCSSLTSIDVSGFDTGNVLSMDYMFKGCSSLTNLDVSGFDTANVGDMSYMFSGCSSLANLDVSGFDTSNVYVMDYMFNGCSSLISLDVSGFDTGHVGDMALSGDMSHMFSGCSSLTNLDVSGFNTSHIYDAEHMFSGCSEITFLDLSNFDMTEVCLTEGFLADDNKLEIIKTPLNLSQSVDLPGTFVEKDVIPLVKYTKLPLNLATSKTLVRHFLSIDPTSKTIVVDDEFTITATVFPDTEPEKTITWSSDKPEIATVDTNGKVKGVSVGKATITAKTENDLEATCEVTVIEDVIPVESISVNPTTKTILVDDEFVITATVLPIDATDRSVTWSSDKPTIATVDNTGRVKGIAEGIAVITATTSNNLSATCEVTVKKAPAPTYRLIVVDKRTSPPHPELVTASVTRLEGDRYLLINDSDGKTIRPWIKADSSLKYDSMVVYDMRLTDSRNGGNDMNDFGECTIRLALPSDMSNTTGTISLVTIKDGTIDKSLAYSVKEVDGVLCIIFTTPHFTDFAILYKKPAKKIIPPPKPEHHDTESTTTVTTVQQYYEWPVANPNVNRVLDSIPKTGDISQ